MAHKLLRLAESLYNKPHLVTGDYLNQVIPYIESRNSGSPQMAVLESLPTEKRELHYNPDTKIGIVDINGPLTYVQHYGLCGPSGPSYQAIRDEVGQMIAAGAKYIVLDQDSPGGEAYQAFETARHIRELADQNGVRLITYVDGMSASASYAFSAVSHEIIMNPQSSVGSIGVVVKLRNTNEAMKRMGVEDTYIFAGESKVPFDAEGKFSASFLDEIRGKINVLYEEFVTHISDYRGISRESVIATQAKTFGATEAISLGLADKQMTLDEFSEYLAELKENGANMPLPKLFKLSTGEDPVKLAELQAHADELATQLTASEESRTLLAGNLADTGAKLTEVLASNDTLAETVASLQGELAELKTAQAEAKLSARTSALSAVVAQDQVEGLMANLSGLDDTAFHAVVGTFASAKATVEQSELMTELGQDADADASVQTDADTDPAAAATRAAIARMTRK